LGDNHFTNSKLQKNIKSFLFWILSLSILLINFTYLFPQMGYDYALVVSWANDYNFAWNKHGVFNILFSPQRCFGVPVWYNPLGVNFSLFHILSLIFSDIGTIVAYVVLYSALSYFSVKKFLSLFKIDDLWGEYLSVGWCLQGFILIRMLAGHLPFINIGVWPFLSYLLLKSEQSWRSRFLTVLLFSFLYSHDFYMANVYLFLMFPVSFLLLCCIFFMNKKFINVVEVSLKLTLSMILTVLMISPKIIAINQLTKNFQRDVLFSKVGWIDSANFVFSNWFLPFPFRYEKMTGWWYGNWESVNYLFPFLMPVIIFYSFFNFKENKRLILGLIFLFIIGVFIISGSYADYVGSLPIAKSFHVNPRWMPILSLGVFSSFVMFFEKMKKNLLIYFILFSAVIFTPFIFLDKEYLGISYTYRDGYDVENNQLDYCYEPIFGLRSELFPFDKIQGKYADPRCYVGENKCSSYELPAHLYDELEQYKLKPFKN